MTQKNLNLKLGYRLTIISYHSHQSYWGEMYKGVAETENSQLYLVRKQSWQKTAGQFLNPMPFCPLPTQPELTSPSAVLPSSSPDSRGTVSNSKHWTSRPRGHAALTVRGTPGFHCHVLGPLGAPLAKDYNYPLTLGNVI